jgi:hypothetical protein
MSRRLRLAFLLPLVALASTGCFTVRHQLPPHSYFGTLPTQSGETTRHFSDDAMKNWLLAGLFPWSGFATDDLLARNSAAGAVRYQNLEVETQFTALDTLIWIVPGQFYGYYVWAPRHIKVTGDEIRGGAAAR